MKGDFSKWKHDPENNFNGVLHQQGRVLLDSDWNASTQITNGWQDTAARDAFGPGVAAVPAEERDSFKVVKAERKGSDQVTVTLLPGRLWADGLLVHLKADDEENGQPIARRIASYLNPDDFPESNRTAVVLEVWREEINGFQMLDELIEPALGGPDTTERVHTAFALKLLRLGPGQACENIGNALKDNFAQKGTLTVTLQPPDKTDELCPKAESGGYTGFEHCLYRIEIAQVNGNEPMFKYSRFNGGLVGRGDCVQEDDGLKKITITGNSQAITSLDMDSFYLEVIEKDDQGFWRVVYGAEVTLDGDTLNIIDPAVYQESFPSGIQFFRLWDGIKRVNDYPEGEEPQELCDGIHLQFSAPAGVVNYKPGDYWTFSVRAGEIGNSSTLIDSQSPEGVHYHRVPLAVLHWNGEKLTSIRDCRRVFQPLTNKRSCCRYTVGNGGDCGTIEEALQKIAKRPMLGAEICLLPGIHTASAEIRGRANITIKGCGQETWVFPAITKSNVPVFHIVNSRRITLENMLLSKPGGTAIHVEGCDQVEIKENHIFAYKHAIDVDPLAEGKNSSENVPSGVRIHDNNIFMLDRAGGDVAISLYAYDSSIERNTVAVIPAGAVTSDQDIFGEGWSEDPTDECVTEPETIAWQNQMRFWINSIVQLFNDPSRPKNPFKAHGGIQIASGCERIKVIDNFIRGGWGNGITLGSYLDPADVSGGANTEVKRIIPNDQDMIWFYVEFVSSGSSDPIILEFKRQDSDRIISYVFNNENPNCIEAPPGNYEVRIASEGYKIADDIDKTNLEVEFGIAYVIKVTKVDWEMELSDILATTSDIRIEENEISYMGLSGIGTPQANLLITPLLKSDQSLITLVTNFGVLSGIVEDLIIYRNRIFSCLQNVFDPRNKSDLSNKMRDLVMLRGEGGISLGICENLSICENRIEENGRNHLDPICGIFISNAGHVDISHNQILNNGPIDIDAGINLYPGIRGGVVLRQVISMLMDTVPSGNNPIDLDIGTISALKVYAARIHDNVVEQPMGQALIMNALGPASILNNRFSTDFSSYANRNNSTLFSWIERYAGAVFITNSGRRYPLEDLIGNPKLNSIDYTGGYIEFSNNQIRLGADLVSITSQFIATKDDLGFYNNYSEVLAKGEILRVNTMLLARYLRAGNNRFREDTMPPSKVM